MKLTEFLTPENIRLGITASSKKRVLELVGEIVAEHFNQQQHSENEQNLCPVACFTNLFKREKLGSTGINQGVALPHAKLPENSCASLQKPIAVFLRLEEPIEFEATDNKQVDLIYALLFPENCCLEYKSKLPITARLLSDKALLKQLRGAESVEDIWQILDLHEMQDDESEA